MNTMRNGFTTGSCAAAASKAAIYMLITGKDKKSISIDTPKGITYTTDILDIKREESSVTCAVKKDSGDDPDITNGMFIYSTVSFAKKNTKCVNIDGGIGVGRVTKPGLDRSVGEAAINTVPRQMIEKEVREVCDLFDISEDINVVISVPGGEETARKTFNPKLGIEGGISIIGTSGIVEPMSTKALLDTIRLELRQRKELGYDYVTVSPGNYGLDFMRDTYGYDLDRSVKCSNFIGDTIDMAVELGFKDFLYVGHIGKLIKVAGGIMNTHSKEADCRMEILTAIGCQHDVPSETLKKIMDCVTTEEACKLLKDCNKCDEVCFDAAKRICTNLEKRAQGNLNVECVMFSKELGELSKSMAAEGFITRLVSEL